MSNSSWTVTGFGLKAEELGKASADNKIKFVKIYLPEIYKKMQTEGENDININMQNTSDYLDFCREWINDYENECCERGFAALFANAITKHEEGFDVVFADGLYDEEAAVLYENRMPWQMSDRAKNMKAEDMQEIFRKYLDVLEITAVIDYQSVEYCG